MELKDRIKFYRVKHNLTQTGFAQLVGVSRPTLIKWERGSMPIRVKDVQKLNQVLGDDPVTLSRWDIFDPSIVKVVAE